MTYQEAKIALDRAFSKRIVAEKGPRCQICGKRRATDCFHFIPRGRLATRWEPDNCAASCRECNSLEQRTRYDPRWREVHIGLIGHIRRAELESQARILVKYSASELLEWAKTGRKCPANGF